MSQHRTRRSAHRLRVPLRAAGVAAIAVPLAMIPPAAPQHPARPATTGHSSAASTNGGLPSLPAPPKPPKGLPREPSGYRRPASATPAGGVAKLTAASSAIKATTAAVPARAKTWAGLGSAKTLVLYDTTGAWGYLGELYAIGAGNLASHFGSVTAEPVADYVSGQVNGYTAMIYLGSTYNERLPAAFLNDARSTRRPVLWSGDNIWELAGAEGSTADTAFKAAYGWDPASSYFDTTDNPVTVTYKGETFTRNAADGADVLAPHITTASKVTVLGRANCTKSGGTAVACASIAQATGTSFPWAVRSANLTYAGEIPFSHMSETDRYVAFSDLLFHVLAPSAAASHDALVRLEDVNPTSNPATLKQFADYLYSQHVPFSVAVIPEYTDPNGYRDHGKAQTITLAHAPAVVAALKYMRSKGGVIIEHGYTHQYSDVANPYDGVTADDAEFYRARCSATQSPPYQFRSPCQNTDWIAWTGPVPGDSASWAEGRVKAGRALFAQAGLAVPTIWETPHYFASAADYAGIDSLDATRYEREIFASGQLSGQPLNYSRIFGQFFPYEVHDVYGEKIIPENLGNYEPTEAVNNPPWTPAEIVSSARLNLAVTQGTASFFFHPYYALSYLKQIVSGIKGLGYTFVSPAGLPG